MEKIQLCYNAASTLDWIATEEAKKFVGVYEELKQLHGLSVDTYLHQWRYSSELIFGMKAEHQALETALRILYNKAGIPAAITKRLFLQAQKEQLKFLKGLLEK